MEGGNRQSWRVGAALNMSDYDMRSRIDCTLRAGEPTFASPSRIAASRRRGSSKIEGIVNCLEFCLMYIGGAMGALLGLDSHSGVGSLGVFGRELIREDGGSLFGLEWKRMEDIEVSSSQAGCRCKRRCSWRNMR